MGIQKVAVENEVEPTGFTNGDYVLTARIFDAAGNMIVTEGVPVRIQN